MSKDKLLQTRSLAKRLCTCIAELSDLVVRSLVTAVWERAEGTD